MSKTLNDDPDAEQRPYAILVAEDDEDDFIMLSEAIKAIEVKSDLTWVNNCAELLKVLRGAIPELLFLDLMMPVKSGQECLREIRSDSRYDKMPVIIFSGSDHSSAIEYCFQNRSSLFVVKQVSTSSLERAMKDVFSFDWRKTVYFAPRNSYVIGKSTLSSK